MRQKYFYRATSLTAFTALILLLNWGCKKDKPGFYYISYEINGVRHVDTSGAVALMYANNAVHSYSADLIAHKSLVGEQIHIFIFFRKPLNTITIYQDTTQTMEQIVNISYLISPYQSSPELSSFNLYPNGVMVHFTNISTTSVKGTFSGNVVPSDHSSVSSISNGVFYLKVH